MSDFCPDTEYVGERWCPTCEPERDPTQELLNIQYCGTHTPNIMGSEDILVTKETYMSGSAEAGGAENAAWNHFIRHGKVVPVVSSSAVEKGSATGTNPETWYYC